MSKKEKRTLPDLWKLLEKYGEVELEDVVIEAEKMTLHLPAFTRIIPKAVPKEVPIPKKPEEIIEARFSTPVQEYPGHVSEVRIGATKSEGGTRSKSILIGGETTPSFYTFERATPHPPVIAGDVFDMKIPLPGPVKRQLGDVIEDPAEWAKLYVDKLGVDIVVIELISTDPLIKDTPAKEAAKVVEDVLQAVDVPIVVGGSGSPEKDGDVLAKAAEVAEGERILLSSATPDLYKPIAEAAKEFGHNVLAWTSLDINLQKELNRKLFEFLPKERIVIDPTSAALGYGIEYAFTIMERMRLAALWGDEELQMPLASATSNSWAAREAWRKDPELGPREMRGPLWETTSALTFLLAGVDLFFMLHPAAIRTTKGVIGWLMGEGDARKGSSSWATTKM